MLFVRAFVQNLFIIAQKNEMAPRTINVALVGYGMAGEFFHAPLIHTAEGLVLHSVVERHKERSKERYPHVKVVRSIDDVLKNKEVDLVVIASPNNTHFDFAKRALLANKHVVIDKPFASTAKEADELSELSKKQKRVLSIFQNRRWDGDFLTVKKLIENGELGRIQEYQAHYDRFRPNVNLASWKEGEGVFYDLGPHLIDQALVLFGLTEKVSVKIERQRVGALAEDYFEVVLEYAHTKVFLSASMLKEQPRPRFWLKGSKGTFVKYGLDPQENALKAGAWPTGDEWGTESEENWGTLQTEKGEQKVPTEKGNYPAYYQNVYQSIVGLANLKVGPGLPLAGIRIIEEGRK